MAGSNDLRARAARTYRTLRHAGTKHQCPCCGARLRTFVPSKSGLRCPACRSKVRHRLMTLYVQRELPGLETEGVVLHVAPDRPMGTVLRRVAGRRYVRANLHPPRVEVAMDIEHATLRDGSIALLIISHVLEHVADAGVAMAEMARVVQPGGRAIALVPIHPTNAHTIEDPTVTEPKERARVFGQHDHVRWFGHDDYVARLEAAGFAVDVVQYADAFTQEEQARYGLTDVPLYICKR